MIHRPFVQSLKSSACFKANYTELNNSYMRDDLELIIIHFEGFRFYIPLFNAHVFTNVS